MLAGLLYGSSRRSGQAAPARGSPGVPKGDVVSDITIKSIHAVIDTHGVRQKVRADKADKAVANDAAAMLADTKRGKADAYRTAILALVTAMVTTPEWQVADRSKAGRREHVLAGGAAFTVDAGAMFPDGLAGEAAGLPWNDGAALSMWLKRNVHRVGAAGRVETLRVDDTHRFWILVTTE